MTSPALSSTYPSIDTTKYHLCQTYEDVKHFAQHHDNPNTILGPLDSGFGFFAGDTLTGPKETLVAICGPTAIEEILPKFEEVKKLDEEDDRTEEEKDAEAWEGVRRLEKFNKRINEGRKREDWNEDLGEWKEKAGLNV
jgi:hypothetical protein